MSIRYLAVLSMLFLGLSAHASPPYSPNLAEEGNRWTITAFNDASPQHQEWATQTLCFYPAGTNGTHQRFYWVSTSFPDWNGIAVQEGDQIFMHGDYAKDVGHDSMTWEVTTATRSNEGYGHWAEWREDTRLGRTIGFVNAKLTRIGHCKQETWEEALEYGQSLEYPYNEEGERIVVPFGLSERELEELQEKQ